jgi:hypothetical protein
MPNMEVRDCDGKCGGLAIFWKKDVVFRLRAVSRLHIDGDVVEKDGFVWHFMGVYGEPRTDQRELTWRALHTLIAVARQPWMCAGDFNEVLLSCEKEGGQLKSLAAMDRFRNTLEDCALSSGFHQ